MEFLAGLSHPELPQFLVRLFSAQGRHSRGQVEARLSPCSAHWALCPVHGYILHTECFPWKFPRQPSSCGPGCLQGWGCYREWFSNLHKNTRGLAVALPPVLKTVCIRKPIAGFSGGPGVWSPPASADDTGSAPGPRRSHMPWSN